MSDGPEFDIILWGGSSFVGKLVAEHLFETYGIDSNLRWAIGGRNRQKLEATREKLGEGAAGLPLLVGDAHDRQFLDSMVRQTKVMLSTVGPYKLYGRELVEACAASGTDYCDLTGEIPFVREMMDLHDSEAKASGARIVTCCGVDSLPSDLGVFLLHQYAKQKADSGIAKVTNEVKAFKGGFSGGTLASLGLMRDEAAKDGEIAKLLANPYAICPPGRRSGIRQPSVHAVMQSGSGRWLAPFFMAIVNTRVVHATNAHVGYPYGDDFTYAEGFVARSKAKANIVAAISGAFFSAYGARPIRAFLNKFFLPKPGEGPSKEERENGCFVFHFVGTTRSGERLDLTISGDRDPGYGASSRMIGEVAVCLAKDMPKGDQSAGLLTPVAALGDRIVQRLIENSGVQFRMVDGNGETVPLAAVLNGGAGGPGPATQSGEG